MNAPPEAQLRVAPFVRGVESRERVIIRRKDAPEYLCLTRSELQAIEELQTHPVEVGEFLGRHLGGHGEVDFKTAVSLLVRLHQGGFVVDATGEVQKKLKETMGGKAARSGGGLSARLLATATAALDLPLVQFKDAEIHPLFRATGRLIESVPALLAYAALLVGLCVYSGVALLPDANLLTADLAAPEGLLLKAFLVFSLAASWTASVQMAALAGAGARYVGASLRLTGLCFVRLAVDDTDSFMLEKKVMLRYQLFTLTAPWLWALLAWQLTGVPAVAALASLLAAAFALIGLAMLCPLWRSPLVKIGEGYLATLGILERANAHLARGLLSGLGKGAGGAKNRGDGAKHGEHATQLWITFYASVAIIWLYGMSLLFTDALLVAAADLFVHATHVKAPVRAAASALMLAVMTIAVLMPLMRLLLIPFQNLAAVASLPLRRARKGIGSFYDQTLSPSAAVTQFLREIPILADLPEAQLGQLTAQLKYRRYNAGARVITKGEAGQEFFILADGKAEVVIGGGGEPEEVVDQLSPGDSFGEIALIEHVKRTATIRATSPVKTLVLERASFDRLFPEGSEERTRLTTMIRQVKLVLESQALSHLAPRQIRELLRHSKPVVLKAGDVLIRENTTGDAAYLIEAGEVQVARGSLQVATLGRGELVGAISLIKDVKRTATVQAKTEVRALAIDKPTFLKMCMSNVFVALLVAELSDKQIAQTQKQAG